METLESPAQTHGSARQRYQSETLPAYLSSITYIAKPSLELDTKAMRRPSGDHEGNLSLADGLSVRRRGLSPFESIT